MFDNFVSFIDRHKSFILTTHDSPDADGIGAEFVISMILEKAGKDVKIINAAPVPEYLQFVINDDVNKIEKYDPEKHIPLIETSAVLVIDTSDEFHLGSFREALKKAKETFVIDHHELKPLSTLSGLRDPTASSTSELTIELACFMGVELDEVCATAAYAGIVKDSGFFAYPKTTARTFKAAIKALEWGANPNYVYKQLMENSSCASVLLQKQALSSIEFYAGKTIAIMILLWEDFEKTGTGFDDIENIVNIPLRAKEVEVSVLLKEKEHGEIFCSLRSKGRINVSKIAQDFGGGGHATAAGFRSYTGKEEIIKKLLSCVETR